MKFKFEYAKNEENWFIVYHHPFIVDKQENEEKNAKRYKESSPNMHEETRNRALWDNWYLVSVPKKPQNRVRLRNPR